MQDKKYYAEVWISVKEKKIVMRNNSLWESREIGSLYHISKAPGKRFIYPYMEQSSYSTCDFLKRVQMILLYDNMKRIVVVYFFNIL